MEPSVEIYQPSRLYARIGWAALAGSLICILCGFRAPLAFRRHQPSAHVCGPLTVNSKANRLPRTLMQRT